MKRSVIIAQAILFGGLLLGIGGLAAYKVAKTRTAAAGAPAYEHSEAVEISEAREISWQPRADLVGTVFAMRSVRVSNELAGVITHVGFESGSIVEPGQLLLKLADTTEQADLGAARASVRVAESSVAQGEARLRLAESMLDRLKSLEGKAVAAAEFDRARSELDTARADIERWRAEVDQAKARVAQVQARIAKLTIVAPFRARAGMRMVHEGQYLAEGADVVMLQELTDRIYLDFAVPQEYTPRVHPGLTVLATGELLGPDPVPIEVVALDAAVNNDTRNIRVRSVVDNTRGVLVPGMFVRISVPVEPPRPYVVVPGTAVRRASYADFLFTVAPDASGKPRAKQRFVKLGQPVGDDVIVLEGLKAGERVASTGSFKLRDGVAVAEAAPPSPAGASAPGAPAGASSN